MLITTRVVVPPNTPRENPLKISLKIPAGVLKRIWVLIPHGHRALAHMIIKHGETQIVPFEGDISGNGESIVFDEFYEFHSDDTITLEAWNEDEEYEHMFIVRLLVQPKHIASPELVYLSSLKRALEVMGIE